MTLLTPEEKRRVFRELKAEFASERRAKRKAAKKATAKARAERPMTGQRTPRVKEPLYLAWIRRRPCLHCGKTPSDAAHIRFVPQGSGWRFPGMGAKPDDFRAVPLCRSCHKLQHSMNECKFWQDVLCLDPVETVNRLRCEYLGEDQ